MSTATARAYQPRFTGRFVPFEMRKSPQNKAFYGLWGTYSEKVHCIKDSVLLDPACGSGNFLTETYVSIRRLENKIIKELTKGQKVFGSEGFESPIKVSISQFYGIEINDFAVTVAKTALWIAESQMMRETEDIVLTNLNFLPLKTNATVIEGNALRIDWESVVSKNELNYIIGNPPFVGTKYQSKSQKEDILAFCPALKPLDYVTGWYKKASDLIQNTEISCAFVSTNSITQGEQVAPLWEQLNVSITFAHRTFRWDSEANIKAHVHCVIIGFEAKDNDKEKLLFDNNEINKVSHINGYLIAAPDVSIIKRSNPICKIAPNMSKGSQPTDGGNLLLTQEEKDGLLSKYPRLEPFVKRYMGADDLINNKIRYCLWLKNCPPEIIRKSNEILKRLELVSKSRLESTKEATRKWADRPTLFTEDRQPESDYLILPVVSSEKRRYMPIGYVTKDVIANANAQMIPNADLFTFGILCSNVHNSWLRAICGRMKSDYAYSATIVYNNFPWPNPTPEQKAKIEATAHAILDARALYPDSSLADLYDPLTMPPELRKAHNANDKAVMEAYGLSVKSTSESDCVAFLMNLYKELSNMCITNKNFNA